MRVCLPFSAHRSHLTISGRWLYALILCMDACFRLQNRNRSSNTKDPTLGPGWAFFIDDGPYREHLKNYIHKDEVSLLDRMYHTCLTSFA